MGSRRSRIDVSKTAESYIQTGGSGLFWQSKEIGYEERHVIRILPPLDDQPLPWIAHAQHWAPGPKRRQGYVVAGDQNRHPITCERIHGEGQCAPCEFLDWCAKNDVNANIVRAEVQYYMGIILEPGTTKERLCIWGTKKSVCEQVEGYLKDPEWGEDVLDPDDGRNFVVVRHGNPNVLSSIKYEIRPASKVTSITIPDWEERAPELAKIIEHTLYEKQVEMCRENLKGLAPVDEIFRQVRARARQVAPASKPAPKAKSAKKAKEKR